MTKRFLVIAAILITATVLSVAAFATSAPVAEVNPAPEANAQVVTVSKNDKGSADASKILETRFLNMLNHSFVYNGTFDSVEEMVNASMPALLNYRDSADDSYIAENYVADYLLNMYGVEVEDFSQINTELGYKEGYVYIIPKGFTNYSHKIVSVAANEDGSFTVTSKISISSHDSGDITETCTSLFVPNADSAFGFSIIYSNIGSKATAI
jgi:hypothetical protein